MQARSAAQKAASQTNGARSHGPVSEQGKAKSARNSVRHGLCASRFVLTDADDKARFEAIVEEFVFNHQAVTEIQRGICRRLAVAHWRQEVCDNLEGMLWQAIESGEASFDAGGEGLPGMASINRYRGRLARDVKEAEAAMEQVKLQRAQAFQAEIEKQQELASKRLLKNVVAELGPVAFSAFRDVVSEPPKDASAKQDDAEQTNPETPKTDPFQSFMTESQAEQCEPRMAFVQPKAKPGMPMRE